MLMFQFTWELQMQVAKNVLIAWEF